MANALLSGNMQRSSLESITFPDSKKGKRTPYEPVILQVSLDRLKGESPINSQWLDLSKELKAKARSCHMTQRTECQQIDLGPAIDDIFSSVK